ncbi:transporter, major facilitator family protein [Bifidobacterium gallicum DSM 20093 = LMG 11596]|uniref:Transporter, major facilitator family protein n=2 Tax=Bifidobacterium gallicum TaxID=78342 RepID=D1NRV5_9BIFI|nr:transporter, major facilitator family protein [Bifidobacterium gallicum DSM 20093 = LMG 11596]KFI57293.1 transporter, putative fucose permease [Bifidobacterium gallicum DSM 20093 = LMG 11596]
MHRRLVALIAFSFVALGLPMALLGASWPAMGAGLHDGLAWVGGIAMTICAGSLAASLCSPWLRHRFGIGRVVVCGVLLSALACVGFACARSFVWLVLFAVPYGWAAGMLTACLNAYIAPRYAARFVSWFHALKSAGAMVGHTVLGVVIAMGAGWRAAYGDVGLVLAVCALPCCAVGLWRYGRPVAQLPAQLAEHNPQLDLRADVHGWSRWVAACRLPKVVFLCIMVVAYTTVQQTTMLWASSYMVHAEGMSVTGSGWYASLFFVGLTIGLLVAGLVAPRVAGPLRIRIGECLLIAAIIWMLLPIHGQAKSVLVPMLLGVGVAPINPAVISMTPHWYGAHSTRTVIGLETAMVTLGTFATPALFGVVANVTSMHALPWYLLIFTLLAIAAGEAMMARHRLDQDLPQQTSPEQNTASGSVRQ